MEVATIIDLVLTPLAGGVGAWFGMRNLVRKRLSAGETVSASPAVIGGVVAAALLTIKLFLVLRAA
jgi:hypothetical protein